MYTDVHFSSGATHQPKAKIVGHGAGLAVCPKTDGADIRAVFPATVALNAAKVRRRATLWVNYKFAGCIISSIIYRRIIIMPIKTQFHYVPAHIV